MIHFGGGLEEGKEGRCCTFGGRYHPDDVIAGMKGTDVQQTAETFEVASKEAAWELMSRELQFTGREVEGKQKAQEWIERNSVAGVTLHLYEYRSKKYLRTGYCAVKDGIVIDSIILVEQPMRIEGGK